MGTRTSVERGHRAWQVHIEPPLTEVSLRGALDHVRERGGGPTYVWVSRPDKSDDDVAASFGLRPARDLHELRVELPLPEATIVTRLFVAGVDDDAWLRVNNRAFADHPEQGGWNRAQLERELGAPWFDAEGFLLHEIDGRLAGFCWTKVHEDPERLGEIYVIAVDPDFHGRGLGKALTLAGLSYLHRDRGIDTGMLYVDAANVAATTMYAKLGFTRHHVDRAYYGEL